MLPVVQRPTRRAAAASIALILLASGCGNVVLDAPKVTLLVRANGIVFAGPNDEQRIVGGETVLRIANDDPTGPHRIALVRVADGGQSVPDGLIGVDSPRDDDRIIAMTQTLKPKVNVISPGGFTIKLDKGSFHVHLRRGETYLLLDTIPGGAANGVVRQLTPGSAEGR